VPIATDRATDAGQRQTDRSAHTRIMHLAAHVKRIIQLSLKDVTPRIPLDCAIACGREGHARDYPDSCLIIAARSPRTDSSRSSLRHCESIRQAS